MSQMNYYLTFKSSFDGLKVGRVCYLPKDQQNLALCHIYVVGYRRLRRMRASAVRNGQLMPVWALLRACAHAAPCAGTRACRVLTLNSGSALWSQLPCRGVNARGTRRARRRASAGGNAR